MIILWPFDGDQDDLGFQQIFHHGKAFRFVFGATIKVLGFYWTLVYDVLDMSAKRNQSRI